MIPIRDNIASRSFPIVNLTLIMLNISVFLYEVFIHPSMREFILKNGIIPAVVVSLNSVPLSERILPFFTSMFIHGSWFHLIGNMLFLYVFGDNVEDRMGHFKYLLFYITCGILAALLQIAFNHDSTIPMIGASGAVSGVLGAYLLFFPRARVLTLIPVFVFIHLVYLPSTVFIVFWFLIQFLSGLSTIGTSMKGGIAFWAHIGGFVAGLIMARYINTRRKRTRYL